MKLTKDMKQTCLQAIYQDGHICLSYAAVLKSASPFLPIVACAVSLRKKLSRIEIGHLGLSWPDLDEDLSHAGLRAGRFGQD
jgi:hypothetical protein